MTRTYVISDTLLLGKSIKDTIEALKMLKEIIIKKGLNKPRITTYPDNIPSIRVAEKFGGKLLDGPEYTDKSYITYEVDLAEDNVHTM